jgi:hypothetical protein
VRIVIEIPRPPELFGKIKDFGDERARLVSIAGEQLAPLTDFRLPKQKSE